MPRNATPKRERKRLAKAELWLLLAIKAQKWSSECVGADGSRPMSEWGDDDPMVTLCRTYDLTAADLSRLLTTMGDELERRALRAGYEDAWVE